MIQVQFTDEGKLHTVTFSGEDAEKWSKQFIKTLIINNEEGANITWIVKQI